MEVSASMPSAFDSFVNMLNKDQLISFRDAIQSVIDIRFPDAGMLAAPADMQPAADMASEAPHPVPQAEAAAPKLTPEQIATEKVRALIQENLHDGHLDLFGIGLSDAEAIALAKAFKVNNSITNLQIGDNKIGDAGAMAFAEALKTNTSITGISLSNNRIGDTGAIALAEALETNKSITSISLDNNNIGAAGAMAFADALKDNITLTNFYLGGNYIGDMGAMALAEALKCSRSITIRVSLGRNNISEDLKRELEEIAKSKGIYIDTSM